MTQYKEWYEEAANIKTKEQLIEFIDKMLSQPADYDTSVRAATAAILATAWLMNAENGFTVFQASFIPMWFYAQWMGVPDDEPFEIVRWGNALYPQYESHFGTIRYETHKWLVKKARKRLEEEKTEEIKMHPSVRRHMEQIAYSNEPPFDLKYRKDK